MFKKSLSFKISAIVFVIFLLATALYLALGEGESSPEMQPRYTVTQFLAAEPAGYAEAVEPRLFEFPRDHGPHPEFRSEWWYFTGNLTTPNGRHFGYQFTLFRYSLTPDAQSVASHWAAHQVMMGHFAVTDIEGKQFHHFERFSRVALALADAQAEPFRVWLEDWAVGSVGDSFFPLNIQVAAEDISLELELTSDKPLVLQGDRGLSQKGHTPGNASYYYSLTRLQTQGYLQMDGQRYTLEGLSWMDREWGTSALEPQQVGWDWFSLQLSNGWDLMFYQLRLKNGQADTTSSGTLVSPEGQSYPIDYDQLSLRILQEWQSPATGIRYPAQWELKVPERQIQLTLTPQLAQQELRTSITYWEGAVQVSGQFENNPVQGNGYVELTGYSRP